MKSIIKKRIRIIKTICFVCILCIPMFSNAQIRREIKDFNQSFSFKNSYDINLETNTHTDTISNFNYIAKFNIDKNGEGIFDFTNDISNSHTIVRINYSQIKTSSKIKYLTFGGEHYEKGEIIMITMSINKESNIIEKLIIYNYKINKAYVFY